MNYRITKVEVSEESWQVWWDDTLVYQPQGNLSKFLATAFANGLEQGITGSKTALVESSQITTEYIQLWQSSEPYNDYDLPLS